MHVKSDARETDSDARDEDSDGGEPCHSDSLIKFMSCAPKNLTGFLTGSFEVQRRSKEKTHVNDLLQNSSKMFWMNFTLFLDQLIILV